MEILRQPWLSLLTAKPNPDRRTSLYAATWQQLKHVQAWILQVQPKLCKLQVSPIQSCNQGQPLAIAADWLQGIPTFSKSYEGCKS